jgi:predicted metal-binding membrane protein
MDKLQKIILVSLVSISAASWLTSLAFQNDMMMLSSSASGMSNGNNDDNRDLSTTSSHLFFVLLWTVGMAAMMFPAITPMVLLYNKLTSSENNSQIQVALQKNDGPSQKVYPFKTTLFVGGYLAVWSLTGLVLLFGWSALMSLTTSAVSSESSIQYNYYIYGAILIIAGAYQFSSLKTR